MSTRAEEVARLRQAFNSTSPSDAPRADCPPAEWIWESVRGESSPATLRRTLEHVAVCPVCTEAWRLAKQLEESVEQGREESPRKSAPPRPEVARPARWRLASMAAAAVVALAVIQVAERVERSAEFRDRDREVIELLNRGHLLRREGVLRWQGPEDAEYYNLRVTLASDAMSRPPLAEEVELRAREFRIPAEVLSDLPAGATLQIHLEAVHPIAGRLDADTFFIDLR